VREQAPVWRVPSRQSQSLRPAAFTTERTEKASHNGKKPEKEDSDDVLTAQKIALEGIRRERHRDGKGTGLEPQQLVHEDDVNEEHIHPTWDEDRCPVHHLTRQIVMLSCQTASVEHEGCNPPRCMPSQDPGLGGTKREGHGLLAHALHSKRVVVVMYFGKRFSSSLLGFVHTCQPQSSQD
jgi:hypothetical protein